MRVALFAALLGLVSAPAVAGTQHEEDRLVINPLADGTFEVVETRVMWPEVFWCGAATYVERRRGLSSSTVIWLKIPRGPSRTAQGLNAVTFTLDPEGLPDPGTVHGVSVSRPGQSMQSFQARRYCRDSFTRSTK